MDRIVDYLKSQSELSPLLFGVLFISIGIYAVWRLWPKLSPDEAGVGAARLSQIVLIGLFLSVALMAGLSIIFSYLKLTDQAQPLGLPDGSIRSLIAFSMVLIFVSLSAFLYSGVNAADIVLVGRVERVDESQIAQLQSKFVVVQRESLDGTGNVRKNSKGEILYDCNLFSSRNKNSDDFAKQIFTTLATIFVSVISFYFGSSTTASGVGAAKNIVEQATQTERLKPPANQAQPNVERPVNRQN